MEIGVIVKKRFRHFISRQTQMKLMTIGSEMIEINRKLKIQNNEKIEVVFVCHRPALWGSLRTVFEACNDDERFRVTIVTIPNKKQLKGKGLNHEEYVTEGAEEFFEGYPCKVVRGYDYETGKWLDLRGLDPDYLFFQTPYDICRPPEYHGEVVSLYTKLCYVHYGMPFMDGTIAEQSFPVGFLENTYFHFAEFTEMREYYVKRVAENAIHRHDRVVLTGYPKLDHVNEYEGCDSVSWLFHGEQRKFRIMWTPRWNRSEGNCTFFDHKDCILDYAEQNPDVELLFRPHPQAFAEYVARRQMTEEEIAEYKNRYQTISNASIDEQKEYLPSFYSADVLITDESSIIPEYFLTGKPIIFTYKKVHLNDFAKEISKGFYWAAKWEELRKYLDDLRQRKDPLSETRREIIGHSYYLPKAGAGYEIKEKLAADFYRKD